MNILHLRTLVAIHDHPTFSEAASALYLTPAAVSQQMRTLEDELQMSIFDRSTRPPRLNAHGLGLIDDARDILSKFSAFTERAKAQGEIAGTLRLGSATGITRTLIPQALRELRDRYPRLQVRIEEGLTDQLIERVRRRELDAALVTEPMFPETDMKAVRLMEEPMHVLAPASVTSDDWREVITTNPFLRLNRTTGMGKLIDVTLRRAGVSVRESMELDNSESVMELVAADLGVGIVPFGRVQRLDPKAFKAIPFGSPPVSRRVVVMERADAQRSDLADILFNQLLGMTSAGTPQEAMDADRS